MPVHVEKRGNRWAIVERGGTVKGYSDSKAKAQASANARNAGSHGWKPTKRR